MNIESIESDFSVLELFRSLELEIDHESRAQT
jgi:hypothetical protein